MTIHKCQGLSLDCAIVDLSNKVFSAGMDYVALSRVRSLSGLHVSAFDPCSIIASPSCIKEINRLREAFRKDVPLYDMPPQAKSRAAKRKLTGEVDVPKARKLVKLATKTLAKKKQCRLDTLVIAVLKVVLRLVHKSGVRSHVQHFLGYAVFRGPRPVTWNQMLTVAV